MKFLADKPARGDSVAPASGSRGRIKGTAFSEFLSWYEVKHGRAKVLRAVTDVSETFPGEVDANASAFGILASRWYPAEVVHGLVDALTVGASEAELQKMADDAAEHIMGRTLRGVYKALFSMIATPERHIKYIDRLWSLHYDTGILVGMKEAERRHRMRYSGWTSHHRFICRMNMAASRPIYSAMGCKGVDYERIRCVSEGAPVCENLITWER